MGISSWFGRKLAAVVARHAPQSDAAEATRGPMKIFDARFGNWDASREKEAVNPFDAAQPMKGVVPEGASPAMAMDNALVSNYAYAAMLSAFTEGLQAFPYTYLSELTQRPEYRRPSEIIAKEMTRKWLTLKATGEEDKTDKIKAIEGELKRLDAQAVFRKAAEMDGYFGRSQVYMELGYSHDEHEESMPLVMNRHKIRRNSLKKLVLIEPIWTYPNQYNSDDPRDPTFYRPQSWFVMGKSIHATRLLTFIGRPVPDILKPAYTFGGLSLTQMLKPYVDNWIRTRQSVSDLIHSFSVLGLKTNLGQTLDAGAMTNLKKRITMFNAQRDNSGVMVMDKDEEFFNVSVPLGSLDKLQAQAQEHQSSVAGIPLSILLGITPSGLNASSEGEIRIFYQWVEAQQEAMFTTPFTRLLEVIQLSLFGDIDKEITFQWEPLWSLSDKELAEVRKLDADTDVVLIDAGVISPEEARGRVAGEEDSPYNGLDLSVMPVPPDGGEGEDPFAPEGEEVGGEPGEIAPNEPPPAEAKQEVQEVVR